MRGRLDRCDGQTTRRTEVVGQHVQHDWRRGTLCLLRELIAVVADHDPTQQLPPFERLNRRHEGNVATSSARSRAASRSSPPPFRQPTQVRRQPTEPIEHDHDQCSPVNEAPRAVVNCVVKRGGHRAAINAVPEPHSLLRSRMAKRATPYRVPVEKSQPGRGRNRRVSQIVQTKQPAAGQHSVFLTGRVWGRRRVRTAR